MSHRIVLFFNEIPPSSTPVWGGYLVFRRLLAEHDPTELIVLCSKPALSRIPEDGLLPSVRHIVHLRTDSSGRWGLSRLKCICDWSMLPFLVMRACVIILADKVEVIVTVAQDYFFISAILAGLLTRRPTVLFVHDNWMVWKRKLLGPLTPNVFRWALRNATMVSVISEPMARLVREISGVTATVQLPFTDIPTRQTSKITAAMPFFTIAYSGTLHSAVNDILVVMMSLVLGQDSLNLPCELRLLCATPESPQTLMPQAANDPRIKHAGWLPHDQVQELLAGSDALLLPFSFSEKEHAVTSTAFPSKAADYLAAKVPIIVVAPVDSTVARYMKEKGCALCVTTPDPSALAAAVRRLMESNEERERLAQSGWRAFLENHETKAARQKFYSDLETAFQARTRFQGL